MHNREARTTAVRNPGDDPEKLLLPVNLRHKGHVVAIGETRKLGAVFMYEFSGGKTKNCTVGGAEGNAAAISHEEKKSAAIASATAISPSTSLAQFAMRRDRGGTPDREPSSPIHFNSS